MGETVKDVLVQAQWLVSKGRAEEPAKLLLPRIAAKRRAQNKEKRTRVVFECTPEQFGAFHAQLKRYRETIGNITIAHDILIDVLASIEEGLLQDMAEERERNA